MKIIDTIYESYQRINQIKPVVLNITNTVTQDFMANALLALGASAIMSSDSEDACELITIASAVNLNIGTLDDNFIKLSENVATQAKKAKKPIVLDPVGAGASTRRTALALNLAKYAQVIRGNASEIMALNDIQVNTRGVDSLNQPIDAIAYGQKLATKLNCIVAISGVKDFIISTGQVVDNHFGNELLTRVTGCGCVLNAIIAAFMAVDSNYFTAVHAAITFYTLCADQAKLVASTPARFKLELIDSLYAPDWDLFREAVLL